MFKQLETKDGGLFKGSFGTSTLEMKEVTESGEFAGYASIFGALDNGRDIVQHGAFTESLKQYPANKVRLLWQHMSTEVIGKITMLEEDNRGLKIEGKLVNTPRGKEVLELLREECIEGLSIGYRAKVWEYDRDNDVRTLSQVVLREVSVVTFPMLELAGVNLVKEDGELPSERKFEGLLRDAGFSRKEIAVVMHQGFKSLVTDAVRDAGQDGEDDAAALAAQLQAAADRMRAL